MANSTGRGGINKKYIAQKLYINSCDNGDEGKI